MARIDRWLGLTTTRSTLTQTRSLRVTAACDARETSTTSSPTGLPLPMSPFDEAYLGVPPWEIGRPQPAVESLFDSGRVAGRVIDVGCGTGEHTMLAAARGHDALGVDLAERAVQLATQKARLRGLKARFEVHDALRLSDMRESFDTAIDCGLFHMLPTQQRFAYTRSLSSILRPGAMLYVLCFSELEPNWGGPRRIRRVEIEEAFGKPFIVNAIEPARFATRRTREGAAAWLATITHIGKPLGERS